VLFTRQFPLKLQHSQNPPNRETQISRYLAVQIQIEISISFEIVPRFLSFCIWWILEVLHFEWNLSNAFICMNEGCHSRVFVRATHVYVWMNACSQPSSPHQIAGTATCIDKFVYMHSYMKWPALINFYMWWLRSVGSLKWLVSFTEYNLFYRALLQKRPIILRSLLIVATPYMNSFIKCIQTFCVYMNAYSQSCSSIVERKKKRRKS